MPGLIYAQTLRQVRFTFIPESESCVPTLHEEDGQSVLRYDTWSVWMPLVSEEEYRWEGHRMVWVASKKEQAMWNRRDIVGKGVMIDIDWEHFDWDDDEDEDAWKEFDVKDTPIGFASGENIDIGDTNYTDDYDDDDPTLSTVDQDIETIATSVANATLVDDTE